MVIDAPDLKGIAKKHFNEDDEIRSVAVNDAFVSGDSGIAAGHIRTGIATKKLFLLEISREDGSIISEKRFSSKRRDELEGRLDSLRAESPSTIEGKIDIATDALPSKGLLLVVTQILLIVLIVFGMMMMVLLENGDVAPLDPFILFTWLGIPVVAYYDIKLMKERTPWEPLTSLWLIMLLLPLINIFGAIMYLLRRRRVFTDSEGIF